MTIGTSLLLIAAGAILRYAVTAEASGIDLRVVGLVLMIIGIVGLVLSLLWIGVWSRSRRPPGPGPGEGEVRRTETRY
jgi:heme/copper-type cytochrome/quinol oxidase subunit 2